MSARAERVLSTFPAFAARDVDALERMVTPDVDLRIAPVGPPGKPTLARRARYRGHAGLREWIREIDENYSELTLEARAIEQAGEAFVVLGTVAYARGSVGGGMTIGWVYRFEGDLISHVETHWDWRAARDAARAPLAA
jgi:ketosteroid isomerase-like protein